jgi:hypothetical protein
MQVEVILASRAENCPPIFTIRMRYPRIIHGEVMTHRVFSRNARSSRAVPVKTMLEEVRTIPFVPWHWGKNQKGMQASEECNEPVMITRDPYEDVPVYEPAGRIEVWLEARNRAADIAEAFMEAGYHKQIPNRLLEPFSWMDTLITSTDWDNFLWLRDHEDAEPHIQDLARLVKQAIYQAKIWLRNTGDWHLPYITNDDRRAADKLFDATPSTKKNMVNEWLRKVSAARCARISYAPFDGDSSYEREIERYNMLVTSDRVHASPLEHQATPDVCYHMMGRGFNQWAQPELHGNFTGWIQARKLVPNERYIP